MRRLTSLAFTSLLCAGRSHADPPVADPDDRLRYEVGAGFGFGGPKLDGQSIASAGGDFQVGVRARRWAMWMSYQPIAVSWDPSRSGDAARGIAPGSDGTLNRLGAGGRFNLIVAGAEPRPTLSSYFELFVEAGAGFEALSWDGGGELTRPDWSYGVGLKLAGVRLSSDRAIGVLLRFDEIMTTRPHSTQPTCSGPCDSATPAASWDHGAVVGLTFVVTN